MATGVPIVLAVVVVAQTSKPRWIPENVNLAGVTKGELIKEGRYLSGDSHAKWQLVVFSDPRCTVCARRIPEALEQLEGRDVGVSLRYYFPDDDQVAWFAALVSEIMGKKGKLLEFKLRIWEELPGTRHGIESIAEELGTPQVPLNIAVAENARVLEAEIRRDFELARRLKLRGTPVFILIGPDQIAEFVSASVLWKMVD